MSKIFGEGRPRAARRTLRDGETNQNFPVSGREGEGENVSGFIFTSINFIQRPHLRPTNKGKTNFGFESLTEDMLCDRGVAKSRRCQISEVSGN